MSITIGTKTVTVEERTWKVEILCEKGDDPLVRAYREQVAFDEDGSVTKRDRAVPNAERRLSQVRDQQFKLADIAVTGLQMAGLIAVAPDEWRKEDIEAAKKE